MTAKSKILTDHERKPIEAFSKTGMNSRTIEIKIKKSKTVINNTLKLKENLMKRIPDEDLKLKFCTMKDEIADLHLSEST